MNNKSEYRIIKKIDNPDHKELSTVDYGRLAGACEWGGSFAEVGRQFGVSSGTVRDIYNRFKKTGSPLPAARPGRQKKIAASQENHIRLAIRRNPMDTYTENHKSALTAGINICLNTYVKYIRCMGFKQYKIIEVPKLTPIQQKKRLRWCLNKVLRTKEQWESVIWSDESMFRLGRGVRVIRLTGEELQERHRVGTLKFGSGSLMMWGCFHAKGLGPLVLMRGIINQDKYVTMLANNAIPWIEQQCNIYNRDFIYQDGAPIHTGGYAKWYKNKTMVIGFDSWPPNSPDLNPIEHIWGYLKLRVNRRSIHINNIDQFEAVVRDEWSKISRTHLEALVASIPERCRAVIKAKGGNTKY